MNMFKKGPEIKLSELKVPDFVYDVYYDLRERHLLPLVAILLVALVAVPIMVGQSSSESPDAGSEEAIAGASGAAPRAEVLVARSAPALRDYRRRLEHMHAKDPFAQQYDDDGESADSGSTAAGESGSGAPASTPESPTSPTSESPATGREPVSGQSELTYFSYAIDVRVVPGGSQNGTAPKSAGEATVRRNLPELTMLPSRETPAAIYMGSTKDGKKALMLVSSDVEAIFGDGKCVLGSDSCQLLAMEPGVPETFVYGGAGRTFKIELLKVHLVTTSKLNRAPLGKPKQKGKSKKGGWQRPSP